MITLSEELYIYRYAFGEDNGFDIRLFDTFGDRIRRETRDKATVAILFSLPCRLLLPDATTEAEYIFAAATHPEHRSKGYMSRLIERVCSDDNTLYFLRPANDDLIAFYSKLGFRSVQGFGDDTSFPLIKASKEHKTLAGGKPEGGRFTLMYRYKKPLTLTELHFGYTMF